MRKIKYIPVVFILLLTVLSGCSLPGSGSESVKNDVKITALSTSKSQVTSHMLRLLVGHDTHGKTEPALVNNLGPSAIQHNASINGDADMSGVRYSNTDLTGALEETPIKNPKKAMIATQQGFKKEFDQTFFDSYGFANTYAFMVTKETAKRYRLETISDLAKHSKDLRLGTDSSWTNRKNNGYEGSKKRYGLDLDAVRPVQAGLTYDALDPEELDVTLGHSTGGQIAAYDLKVFKGDKQFFPPYAASAAVTNGSLQQRPEFKTMTNRLTGKISTSGMQRLNHETDGKGREPAIVAEEFSKKHHYFDKQKGSRK